MKQTYTMSAMNACWCFIENTGKVVFVKLRHSLLATLVAVIWGTNFVVIDAGMRGVPPLLFVALRFLLVVFPLIFFVKRPAVSWKAIVGVGLFMSAGQFGLLYLAMSLGLPAGLASLVLQAQVLLTVGLSAVVLKERPGRRQLIGVVLGVAGLVIVAVGRSAVAPMLPLILVLGAALSWAIGNVVSRQTKAASGLGLVVWSGAVVPLPLGVLAVLTDGAPAIGHALMSLQPVTILSALFTAYLSSLLGYGIWNNLLRRYPSSYVVPFTLLVPPVGIAAAWLMLGEVPSVPELAGGALLLAGVATAVLGRSPKPKVVPPYPPSSNEPSVSDTGLYPAPTGHSMERVGEPAATGRVTSVGAARIE